MKLIDISPTGYGPGLDATEILAEAVETACKKGAKDKLIELEAFDDTAGLPVIKAYTGGSPIRFTAGGITIRGPNRHASGFQLDPASYVTPGGNYSVFNTNDQPWLAFEGFRFDGQRAKVKLPSTEPIGNTMIYVSPGSANVRIAHMVAHGVFNGTGESFPFMLAGVQGTVDDCDIFDIIGTGVHGLGVDSRVTRNRIANCTWNSISLFNASHPVAQGNICRSATRRNINLEETHGALVQGNHCVTSGWGNIGTFSRVTGTYIGGNYCEGANQDNFPLGEIDISNDDAQVELGPNALYPKAGGYHVSRSTKAQVAIADPLWSTYRIFNQP